jgi:hypothetical protein
VLVVIHDGACHAYIAGRKKACFFVKAEGMNQQPYQLAWKMIFGSDTVLFVPLFTPFD